MDRDPSQFVPQNGMDVIGADGEKVGEIDGVERDYFIVRKGFFFPQDHYIPMTAISSYEENQVYLNVTKDEALEQEWTNAPGGEITTSGDQSTMLDSDNVNYDNTSLPTDEDGRVLQDTGYVGETTDSGAAEYDRGRDTLAGIGGDVTGNVDRTGRDDMTIDVHEEELVAGKHDVERGEVRISKDVVEEQQTLEVPVTEEEVEVTRRRVDRDVNADDHAFEEGTIEVPLRGEEVDVEKRARVVEEIDVDKTAVTHNERVTDTVRREEVNVDGDNVDLETTDRDRMNRKDDGLL